MKPKSIKDIKKASQHNLLSCEIMPKNQTFFSFDKEIENIQNREQKFYLDEETYTGYKFTITFNPRKWSLAQAWKEGINKSKQTVDNIFQQGYCDYYIISAEAHKNFYPHLHGLVYFKRKIPHLDKRWERMITKPYGRSELLLLNRPTDIQFVRQYSPDIQERDWCTYIMKEYIKYKEYFTEYYSYSNKCV